MELYKIYKKHPLVSTDSRNCPEGSLFFALKGENFDANAYAMSALANGAAYAVIDNPAYALDERFILVDDTLATLQALAHYHRMQLGVKIVGITGTNGKTTSKELIAAVLKEKFNIHFTQGNFNNHIGVPLTLLQIKPEHELVVVEMGANHPGEIKILADIACPDLGIITNVGKAHLEGFGSFEGVKKTKAELYEFIRTNGENIFLNTGNENLCEMAHASGFNDFHLLLTYELDKQLGARKAVGKIVSCSPFLEMNCETSQGEFHVKTELIGTYNAENILAAVAIGNYFGLSNEQIKAGLEAYQPQNNRSQYRQTEHNKLIIDAYNANPTSMRAAILNFAQMEVKNKSLILGDMLELGSQSVDEHQKIVALLMEHSFSDVYLVGEIFQAVPGYFRTFADVNELKQYLAENPMENRFVLIKGSNGIKLTNVLEVL